jgi:hypothetical protein
MILKKLPRVFVVVAGLLATSVPGPASWAGDARDMAWGARPAAGFLAHPQGGTGQGSCDPAFAELFTPRHPVLGRYEVCTDPRPLAMLAPADWVIETLEPADAFGGGGSYDRAALGRLYSGRRPHVARGWTETADRFEAVTLISPYPDAAIASLEPGTLVIRWICDHGGAECKMLNAGR